jgi:tRNA nucleotidyltransferase (CCA-adding enzyme)
LSPAVAENVAVALPSSPNLTTRVGEIPGMDRVLPALDGLPPVYLVGGAVRDLLRGEPSIDLDLAVEGETSAVARALAQRLGGSVKEHGRFGTATVHAPGLALDLARTRRETYPRPGALPMVQPAGLVDDLRRRDFTINAMAVALAGDSRGELVDPHGGAGDLEAGLVRVMHQSSFTDDPTRILRALRYAARLGFELETQTESWLRHAVQQGALDTVSGPRIRDELIGLLAEPEAPLAVERLREMGVAHALDPTLRPDAEVVAAAALGSMEVGADRALAGLAAMTCADPSGARGLVERLDLGAASRDAVLRAARRGPALARELREALRPSQLHGLLMPEPPEALALALALGAPGGPVTRFIADLRPASLEITGDDLLAAGVPQSPAIGRALAQTLHRKLDGELSGRDDELQAALELAREGA